MYSPAIPDFEIERIGIESLLERLGVDLTISFQDRLLHPATEVTFTADWGFCHYHRLRSHKMWIQDRHLPVAVLIDSQQQQLTVCGMPEAQASRQLWHGLIRFGVAAYLCDRNYTPIHAAALIDPNGMTWLIAGKTHSGKSTLVVGLLEAGWQFLSDDSLILAVENDRVVAHAWLGTSLVDPVLAETYPHLQDEMGELVCDRKLIQFQRCYPQQWVAKAQPQGILFPCISPTTELAALESLSPGTALAQLMAHSAPWLMEYPQNHVPKLQMLCHQCQYHNLLLGPILRTQPHRVIQQLTFSEQSSLF